jgi:phosphatidylserine/phosphatidylglycerophosphate/cardiolipin synthase-like enzyme
VPLGVAALSAAPTTKRRRRSRKSQPESADLTAVAEDVAAEALTRGGRAARRRPWLALALGVALVAAIAILLVVLMGRDDASEQAASEAPPLPGGGWYEAMFTTPQRTGTPPAGSSGRLDQRLVQLIDGAQGSVDIAAYDFGLDNVADALIAAHHRGVVVRVVTDSDNKDNPPLKKLRSADIPVVEDQRRALMHHKFAVIDGRTVMTGAWNFAERDTFRHDNNSVVWNSEELARNFSNEFNKMFEGRRFGPTKPKDVPNPVVERDGTRVETYFASEQQVDPLIAERLRAARSSIAFMAFSFTLDDLGEILQDRRKDGVGVWGVIEATGSETEFSEYGKLKTMQPASPAPPFPGCNAGSAVLQDNNPFLLHHKVFVIDEKTVIFGSFNFTSNAAEDNDEALLIVDDPALAQRFLTEFCRVYNVALTRTPARR